MTAPDVAAAMREAADRAGAALLAGLQHRPGDAYADELLRYEAPEDGGESPFGWVEPYTPAVAVWETPEAPQGLEAPPKPSHGRLAALLAPGRAK